MLASDELVQFSSLEVVLKTKPRSFHNGESSLNRNCEITLGEM